MTDEFRQVENFIKSIIKKLKDYKVYCPYSYKRSQNFTGLQTFSYLHEKKTLYLPKFFEDILLDKKIDFNEISTFIHFMLNKFGNEKICQLIKGMILFNNIPEPILSKFFARAYTLESPFYGIMNQNLMKRNYNYYSTYIKLLYKGILNYSYPPKTDCALYRGTKLETFEINYLKELLKKKKSGKEIPIIYSTSFLSFSTKLNVSKYLAVRRHIDPDSENKNIIVEEPSTDEEDSLNNNNQGAKNLKKQPIKINTNNMQVINIKKQNFNFEQPKKVNKTIKNNKSLSKEKNKSLEKVFQPTKQKNKSIKKNYIKIQEKDTNIKKESSKSVYNEVIIKLKPLNIRDKDKIMITNGFLNQISYYHNEDEVLFFPFSSFELDDIYEVDLTLFIVLYYSNRFLKKVENCIFQIK